MRDLPARIIAETIADIFVREIFGTRRKDVIRLIITEGARFPKLAEFYYHEVIERVTRGAARDAQPRGRRAANCRATRSRAFRNCWSRRRSSRSSGTACSTASRRSTFAS